MVIDEDGESGDGEEADGEQEEEEEKREKEREKKLTRKKVKTPTKIYASAGKRRRSPPMEVVGNSPRRSLEEAPGRKKAKTIPDSSSDEERPAKPVRRCSRFHVHNDIGADHQYQMAMGPPAQHAIAAMADAEKSGDMAPFTSFRNAVPADFVDENGDGMFPLPSLYAPTDVDWHIAAHKEYLEKLSLNEHYQTAVSYFTRLEIVSRRDPTGTYANIESVGSVLHTEGRGP